MKKSILAPVCVFTYNRVDELKEVITALGNNFLASESELFIFSDGHKNEKDKERVDKVREFLDTIEGFKYIHIIKSDINKGLANSIIDGVSKVLEDYNRVIVLEDDLVTTPNFLNFMNEGLNFYAKDNLVHSISGYTLDLPILKKKEEDFYFGVRASSWGWATWKNVWERIDWSVSTYDDFIKDNKKSKSFNKGGSDMTKMLKNQMGGKIDSWAIRFCYQQFLDKTATVFPVKSKVQSIGFSELATHTFGTKRFVTTLDTTKKTVFGFKKFTNFDKKILKQFKFKFSILVRGIDKIKQIING